MKSNQKEEYKQYMQMVGEQMRNSPSRADRERYKQMEANLESPGGYADILHGSKEREIKHKMERQLRNSPRGSTTKQVSFQPNLQNQATFQPNLQNQANPQFQVTSSRQPMQSFQPPAAPPSAYSFSPPYAAPMGQYLAPGFYPMQNPYYPMYPQPVATAMFGTPPGPPGIGVIPQVPVQSGTIDFPRDAGTNSLDSSLERDTSAIIFDDNRRPRVDPKPSNKFIEVNELEFNRKRGDQEEWRLELLKQIQDKEFRAKEEKRKREEEELMLEMKLKRERDEIAARERAEIFSRQKKLDDLKKANEQIHQDAIVRTKAKEFRTPQVTTHKAIHLVEDGYDELERMLVRNAHNELRNDFNLSIERMKQEFSMTNK